MTYATEARLPGLLWAATGATADPVEATCEAVEYIRRHWSDSTWDDFEGAEFRLRVFEDAVEREPTRREWAAVAWALHESGCEDIEPLSKEDT
jgi:hypothetical protein